MTAILITQSLICLIVIWHAAIEAKREAMFYHLMNSPEYSYDRSKLPWKGDEHNLFTEQRLLFFIPVSFLVSQIGISWWPEFLFAVALLLLWYVIHDGMYYRYRNKMNPLIYQEGFWSDNILDPNEFPTFSKSSEFRMIALCIALASFGMAIILEIASRQG